MVLETGLRVWDQRIPIRLVVRRSFTLTDNQENLEVYRDGKLVDRPLGDRLEEDEANQFDEFLRVLIPAHLAQFYFFDGERVRELFREATSENISQAIKDLLGLSLFEKLADDLKDYRRGFIPRLYGKHQDKQAQLAETKAQRDQCNAQIQKLEGRLTELKEDVAELETDLMQKEQEFRRLGGMQRDEIERLQEREKQLRLEYEKVAADLKTQVSENLSQGFLLRLRESLEERLRREHARRQWLTRRDAIEPHINRLIDRLVGSNSKPSEPPLTQAQVAFFSERIEQEVKGLFYPPPPEASSDFWFDLRQEEIDLIRKQLSAGTTASAARIRDFVELKERVGSERRRILEKLQSLGDTEATRELANQIDELKRKQGALGQDIDRTENEIAFERSKVTDHERRITILEGECGKSAEGQRRSDLAIKIEGAVKDYVARAKVAKAHEIERELNNLFMAMANCRDEIQELRLNRLSYEIEVIEKGGRKRSIEHGLSAGQAQVLAMAFVGALAMASGRVLPRIIDTPLGRLDVQHRRDVTKHFFIDSRGTQTILLSTPTEINNCVYDNTELRLLDELKDRVARGITLVKEGGNTRIREGYFGNRV